MFTHRILYLFALTSALFFSSCELYNPEEQIPSYISIEAFDLVDNPNCNEGSLSNRIADAWVLIDDNNIGVYELPVKIPVLTEGPHKLTLGPGIIYNGKEENRDLYLFYQGWTNTEFEFTRGEIKSITPQIMYRDPNDLYEYIVIDDFESFAINLKANGGSEASISKTSDANYIFEGSGSGLIHVMPEDTLVEVRTNDAFKLPNLGKKVFIELNIYSDFHLTVGTTIQRNGQQDIVADLVTLKPTTSAETKWKKIYLDFTSVISNADHPYSEYFYFRLNRSLSPDYIEGRIILDNLKVLYEKQ